MDKNKAINTVLEMPQQFDVEALIEKLLFVEAVEQGLEQSKSSAVISEQEAKKRLSRWLN